ncbi:helix-turn-helix domain-containing protein [candidate division KSB1 bacterium]
MEPKEIGKKISERRRYLNLTQGELAKEINVNKSTISLIEGGKRLPSLEVLNKITVSMGMSLDSLILSSTEKMSLEANVERVPEPPEDIEISHEIYEKMGEERKEEEQSAKYFAKLFLPFESLSDFEKHKIWDLMNVTDDEYRFLRLQPFPPGRKTNIDTFLELLKIYRYTKQAKDEEIKFKKYIGFDFNDLDSYGIIRQFIFTRSAEEIRKLLIKI